MAKGAQMIDSDIDRRDINLRDGDLTADDLCLALKSAQVAWDIETSGLDWRKENIGTCQLHIPDKGILIIKIAKEVPNRLCCLLQEHTVKKVFHHAMFDLRFMRHLWKVSANNVACTKIASKLLDVKSNKENSLKSLLQNYLDVSIDKSQRLSNWTLGVLTNEQVLYAANDVKYLIPLLAKLEVELKRRSLLDLAFFCWAHIPIRVELEVRGYPDIYQY